MGFIKVVPNDSYYTFTTIDEINMLDREIIYACWKQCFSAPTGIICVSTMNFSSPNELLPSLPPSSSSVGTFHLISRKIYSLFRRFLFSWVWKFVRKSAPLVPCCFVSVYCFTRCSGIGFAFKLFLVNLIFSKARKNIYFLPNNPSSTSSSVEKLGVFTSLVFSSLFSKALWRPVWRTILFFFCISSTEKQLNCGLMCFANERSLRPKKVHSHWLTFERASLSNVCAKMCFCCFWK